MITRLKLGLGIAVSVLLAMLGFYAKGKRTGKAVTEARQHKKAIKVMKDAQDADTAVRAMPDSVVHDELRNKWSRD